MNKILTIDMKPKLGMGYRSCIYGVKLEREDGVGNCYLFTISVSRLFDL